MMSQLVKKHTMENESSISLGGTTNFTRSLLSLHKITFLGKYTPLYEKGIKKTQIKSMETTRKIRVTTCSIGMSQDQVLDFLISQTLIGDSILYPKSTHFYIFGELQQNMMNLVIFSLMIWPVVLNIRPSVFFLFGLPVSAF